MRFVFFGTPEIAVTTLTRLKELGFSPELIITAPDKPAGRGLVLSPSPVKEFAEKHNIPCDTPLKITPEIISEISEKGPWDFYLVFAYGKILPKALLESVNGKVLNIHPSLLPKYRGPSPLQAVLLSDDTETGVTLMEIDELVDHGNIIAQEAIAVTAETTIVELAEQAALLGADLIATQIEKYLLGTAHRKPQEHTQATHCQKIQKEDGFLSHELSDWDKWKKYRAFLYGPGVYFFETIRGENLRIKITKAAWQEETFHIEEIIPQNHKRLSYEQFLAWKN